MNPRNFSYELCNVICMYMSHVCNVNVSHMYMYVNVYVYSYMSMYVYVMYSNVTHDMAPKPCTSSSWGDM